MSVIEIELNGKPTKLEVEPRETLADCLREKCSLTATHLGCEHGACGACTVLVDGKSTRSCLKLAVMCDGLSVWTLEGLRDDSIIKSLQKNFHECHGLQCGFCTPGMLVMSRDIISRLERPDEKAIRHELSGQICRCTGYAGIVRAIEKTGNELSPGH
jgi:carbon-monoxide dehydrogenase small subunit